MENAIITIRGAKDNKVYVQGRLNYYVSTGLVWKKYSFLDEIESAEGLTVSPNYECGNRDYLDPVFNQEIVIDGTPGTGLKSRTKKDFPVTVMCEGFKSSVLLDNDGRKNQNYYPVCFNNATSKFEQRWAVPASRITTFRYSNGEQVSTVEISTDSADDKAALKTVLDAQVGSEFCQSWMV